MGTRLTTLAAVTTIEQLEREIWPDPDPGSTFLVRRCTELRRKPVAEFTVEDLRIMLGQQIGVSALLPLAVQVLLRDPLAEGDYHPGDLLFTVLRLSNSAWSDFRAERKRLASTVARLVAGPPFSEPDLRPRDPNRQLRDAMARFLADLRSAPAGFQPATHGSEVEYGPSRLRASDPPRLARP
ncbi:contact-dependent growth inhibition system immunity protein [Micromonospora sp. NPDC048868]|uniref:contact-dependent growth inhibition system immunity protein n=1 Tax=Micromonospora sp. NPDC048868 TaxID=3364258 RepID=UPI00371F75C4